jgi:predicted alpha/beta superfamily hydrolase
LGGGYQQNDWGGEAFIAFRKRELLPYIDQRYLTQPRKMLIGHSLGGLAVMQIFVHHTHLFEPCVCIDPSRWWDHQTLSNKTKRALATRRFAGTSLYLGIAHTADERLDVKAVLTDTTAATLHMRSGLALPRYFEHKLQNGLKYRGRYYPEDSHMSVLLITEYEALLFLCGAGLK